MSQQIWVVQRRGLSEGQIIDQSARPKFLPFIAVRAFRDAKQAERFRAELERLARLTLCPFTLFREIDDRTSSEEELVDLVTAFGLPQPGLTRFELLNHQTMSYIDWPGWWKSVVREATDEQIDCVWNLFEHVEFVRVVEMQLGEA